MRLVSLIAWIPNLNVQGHSESDKKLNQHYINIGLSSKGNKKEAYIN